MSKKFFDIIPPIKTNTFPQAQKHTTRDIPPIEIKKTFDVHLKKPREKLKNKKLIKRIVFSLALTFLILSPLFIHFVLAKTEIIILPKKEIFNFQEKIKISPAVSEINLENKIVPGKIFSEEKNLSQNFSASGKILKKEKAKGIIRIYNNYSTSPQTLIKDTRLISDTGKLFRTTKTIVAPGAKKEKNKLIQSYIDVEVAAAETGPEYNIKPAVFSIQAFAGTEKFFGFKGKSFTPMSGGLNKEITQVTENDIQGGKNILFEKLLKQEKNLLFKKAKDEGFELFEEKIIQEIIEAVPSVKAGAEAEKFELKIKIKILGLGFKKSELENFVKNFVSQKFAPEKIFQIKILKMEYGLETTKENLAEDSENSSLLLNLTASSNIYFSINEENLKNDLAGKSLKEAKIILDEIQKKQNLEKYQIKVFPFWLKQIPKQLEKNEIKLKLMFIPLERAQRFLTG